MLGVSPRALAVALAGIWLSNPLPAVVGLRTTSGSPCASICNKTSSNTTGADVVCLDAMYGDSTTGETFEACVDCQLKSTYFNQEAGESDVNWGLYNLRYAFTTCVFAYPESISNISSPCTVACQDISPAVETGLDNPGPFNFNSWCGSTSFADNVINTCEQCYNETTNQKYLANFLEATRYNCHFPSVSGEVFSIVPTRIFSTVLLPSSLSLSTPTPNSSSVNLPLVIAVPIVGFLILVGSLAGCCFCFIRWRRKRVRGKRMSNHLYDRWNDTSISTPVYAQGGWGEQQAQGPGYGSGGLGFVDSNGQAQAVGYSEYYPQYQQQQKKGFSQEIAETPGAYAQPETTTYGVQPEKQHGGYQ
ncbi:hypothetical protein N7510_007278 [Penicillium lagena]|uniref:uncharacterized protein n=1 Tax=Penicillium lagena TaxID=94218 RepID=UPI0025412496|nr:uncharacterized protein N7510_007278 [Penicillium lagena]KAJ5610559.1 hypothetical protein N7510_007278 [Penicillium lagena]